MNFQDESEYFQIRLKIKISKQSPYASLIKYLSDKRNLPFPYRDMIIKPIMAFWLPLAYNKEKKIKLTKISMVETMWSFQTHIQYLKTKLNLSDLEVNIESLQDLAVESINIQEKEKNLNQRENQRELSGDLSFFEVEKR